MIKKYRGLILIVGVLAIGLQLMYLNARNIDNQEQVKVVEAR